MSSRFFLGVFVNSRTGNRNIRKVEKVLLLVENEENAWVKLMFFNEAPSFSRLLTDIDVRDFLPTHDKFFQAFPTSVLDVIKHG